MKIAAAALALTTLFAGAAHAAETAKRPVVIGYLPTFKDYRDAMSRTDLKKVTHLNIAFVNPAPDASLVNGDRMTCSDSFEGGNVPAADIRDIVARAHAAGVKVLPSLGGGAIPACSGNWSDLLSPAMRGTTVANLLKFADDFGLDGIDVDLEWDVLTAVDTAGDFTPFIQELSAGLKARRKLLTCATASNPGGMVPIATVPYFDYINIMSYDGVGTAENGTIYGDVGGEHASMAMARRDIAVWQSRGATKDQIVLGVPFYGKSFGAYAGGWHDYRDLLTQYGADAAEKDLIGEACVGCSYITYNGRPTIRAKAELARELGAGVMIWELYADAPGADSLLQALDDSLNHAEIAAPQ